MDAGAPPPPPGVTPGGGEIPPPPPPVRDGPPWERARSVGTLFETWKEVLLEPTRSFAEASQTAGIGWSLAYWAIFMAIGTVFSLFWEIVQSSVMGSSWPANFDQASPEVQRLLDMWNSWQSGGPLYYVFALPFLLVIAVVGLFLSAAIIHLFLMMVGGAKRGFEATFRVVAYAGGSAALFNVFPFCGGLIAAVWAIVVEILGLAALHETSGGKAAFAVLAPIVLCCGCALLFFMLLFSLALGAAR